MAFSTLRRQLYFRYFNLRGSLMPQYYRALVKADEAGVPTHCAREQLLKLLAHCRDNVPYYQNIMAALGNGQAEDPHRYLQQMPILTKDKIRDNFTALQSADLESRQWYYYTSGGSTGEPVRLIQDREYRDHSIALVMLHSRWAGREVGEPEVYLWGSEKELFEGTIGWKAYLMSRLANARLLNAFSMTPERMREYIRELNKRPPKLIIAYAEALYGLAKFATDEAISVRPQKTIITTAGTLYPFMEKTVREVFQSPIFNRYGTREVGIIAGQCPAFAGLHVPPTGVYIEIVDEDGKPVPPGVEGNILVTSLINYAMPLVRYRIGDRGVLAADGSCTCGRNGQLLAKVTGRVKDNFRTRSGRIIPGIYFVHMIGVVLNKGDIKKFQIIQKNYDLLVLKIVKQQSGDKPDLKEIIEAIGKVMDVGCRIEVEYVDDIKPTASGKYRYTISELPELTDTLTVSG